MREHQNNSVSLAGGRAGRGGQAGRADYVSRAGHAGREDHTEHAGNVGHAGRAGYMRADVSRTAARSARTSHAGEQVAQPEHGPFVAGRASRSGRQHTDQNFMKYAQDNRFVRWFYALTTGPARLGFWLVIVVLIGVGAYMPARDWYVAHRTEDILAQQVAIRERYNKRLDSEVDGYLSQEGIEDAARKDLGMVMPGEKTITVEGLDEDGNPVVKDPNEASGAASDEGSDAQGAEGAPAASGDGKAAGTVGKTGADGDAAASNDGAKDAAGAPDAPGSKDDSEGKLKGADAADKSKTGGNTQAAASGKEPTTSAEVEAAERAVYENSEWYWKVLDALFFFDGAGGMAVVSTGDAS